MRSFPAIALHWLHQVALAVWLGGILTLGAVSAPAVFGAAKAHGDTRPGMPLYDFAATAMGEVFRRFNVAVLVSAVLLLLVGWLYGRMEGLCENRLRARTLLTAVALAIAAWLTFSLYPQMLAERAAGQTSAFDLHHKTYSLAFDLQLLLLLTVAALTAWMHFDRGAETARIEAESASVVSPHPAPAP